MNNSVGHFDMYSHDEFYFVGDWVLVDPPIFGLDSYLLLSEDFFYSLLFAPPAFWRFKVAIASFMIGSPSGSSYSKNAKSYR